MDRRQEVPSSMYQWEDEPVECRRRINFLLKRICTRRLDSEITLISWLQSGICPSQNQVLLQLASRHGVSPAPGPWQILEHCHHCPCQQHHHHGPFPLH
ncbi:hypothetical protein DKX38_016374 [Salix brachista]|uniref:Uncharacterized protein n=1 Tax=Salix brachista TaxID=2182728 RepID=A0A5N5L9J2_9ROSI|nr:hypothetical protein DKX38_016374 [Salix brachista]